METKFRHSKSLDKRNSLTNEEKELSNYLIDKTIGEGTFGKVKLAIHLISNQKVAIKILEKDKIVDKEDHERILREISLLKKIKHKNIIQIYEVIETQKHFYLIMEFVEGNELFNYILEKRRLDEIESSFFFVQMIEALEYIHKNTIVHRDLKPENILFDENKTIKIIDFGLSNTYESGEMLETPCGSPCYAAPEMIKGEKYSGISVDLWSLGIVLYAMVVGYLPFEDKDNDMLYNKILDCNLEFPNFVSEMSKDLITKILNVNPMKRVSFADIKNHPFYQMGKKIILNKKKLKSNKNEISKLVFEKMCSLGFNKDEIITQLQMNFHNNITTTYYLFYRKFKKIEKSNNANDNNLEKKETNLINIEKIMEMTKTTSKKQRNKNDYKQSRNINNVFIGRDETTLTKTPEKPLYLSTGTQEAFSKKANSQGNTQDELYGISFKAECNKSMDKAEIKVSKKPRNSFKTEVDKKKLSNNYLSELYIQKIKEIKKLMNKTNEKLLQGNRNQLMSFSSQNKSESKKDNNAASNLKNNPQIIKNVIIDFKRTNENSTKKSTEVKSSCSKSPKITEISIKKNRISPKNSESREKKENPKISKINENELKIAIQKENSPLRSKSPSEAETRLKSKIPKETTHDDYYVLNTDSNVKVNFTGGSGSKQTSKFGNQKQSNFIKLQKYPDSHTSASSRKNFGDNTKTLKRKSIDLFVNEKQRTQQSLNKYPNLEKPINDIKKGDIRENEAKQKFEKEINLKITKLNNSSNNNSNKQSKIKTNFPSVLKENSTIFNPNTKSQDKNRSSDFSKEIKDVSEFACCSVQNFNLVIEEIKNYCEKNLLSFVNIANSSKYEIKNNDTVIFLEFSFNPKTMMRIYQVNNQTNKSSKTLMKTLLNLAL